MALNRRGKKMIVIIKGIVTVVVILFSCLFAVGSILINYERTKFCKGELKEKKRIKKNIQKRNLSQK